jgi:uncharacterized membrane protein YdcZ (DUF606 family)
MLWLIVGIVVGAGVLWAIRYSRRPDVDVPWYQWVLGVLAALFVLMAIEVFSGSLVESEARAAWLGLLAFAVPGVILGALAWWLPARLNKGERGATSAPTEKEHVSA